MSGCLGESVPPLSLSRFLSVEFQKQGILRTQPYFFAQSVETWTAEDSCLFQGLRDGSYRPQNLSTVQNGECGMYRFGGQKSLGLKSWQTEPSLSSLMPSPEGPMAGTLIL